MTSDVACPKCQRKLRVPEGCAGQTVRCPACAATFEARVQAIPAIELGAAQQPQEAFSSEPRPAPTPAAPLAEPDPDYPEPQASSRFRGGWPVVRRGLGWVMVDRWIELAILALDLLLILATVASSFSGGSGFRGIDHASWMVWEDQGVCLFACLRMLALLVAGVYMIVGLAQCQRYPAPGPARGVAIAALAAWSFAALVRVGCVGARQHWTYSMIFDRDGIVWIALVPCHWCSEG